MLFHLVIKVGLLLEKVCLSILQVKKCSLNSILSRIFILLMQRLLLVVLLMSIHCCLLCTHVQWRLVCKSLTVRCASLGFLWAITIILVGILYILKRSRRLLRHNLHLPLLNVVLRRPSLRPALVERAIVRLPLLVVRGDEAFDVLVFFFVVAEDLLHYFALVFVGDVGLAAGNVGVLVAVGGAGG